MAPVIRFSDVHKSLRGRPVLRGLSLEVARGETLVILGQSGTGKSVTLKHMVGLMRPDSGTVSAFGHDLALADEESLAKVRRKFGYLFQSGALLNSLSVLENVRLPLVEADGIPPEEAEQAAREKLAAVGLADAADAMPSALSGGMRKRAALARALVTKPEVLLYDEPTAGLDPIVSATIDDLIAETAAHLGVTSVVVTHDMESALRVGTRIAILHQGRIRASWSPDEFRRTDDPIARQFLDPRGPNAPPAPRAG
jgi:phospholipid/cholesterol/gamma-HCH transport system ATP-binding protein